jgi:hypothetical protein
MDRKDNQWDSLSGLLALSRGCYLHRTTQTQKKPRQTCIPRVGFEPMIPVFERAKTFHAFHLAATVRCLFNLKSKINSVPYTE